MYFFFRKFEYKNKDVIFQDVIKCESRDKAKQYIILNYGDYPFKRPKNRNCDYYYYLCESNSYWYDKYHTIFALNMINIIQFIILSAKIVAKRWILKELLI